MLYMETQTTFIKMPESNLATHDLQRCMYLSSFEGSIVNSMQNINFNVIQVLSSGFRT